MGAPARKNWIIGTCVACYCSTILLLYQMSPFFKTFAEDCCGASGFTVGAIFATQPFACFLASPLGSRAIDRIGARATLAVSLLALAGSTFAFGLSASLRGFFFWRTAQGTASAFVFMSINTALMQAAPKPQELAFANGLLEVAGNVALTMGPAMGGVLYDGGGFLAPFAAPAIFQVLLVWIIIFLPAPGSAAAQGTGPLLPDEPVAKQGAASIFKPDVMCLAVAGLLCLGLQGALDPLLAQHLRAVLGQGLPMSTIGLVMSSVAVSSSVAALLTTRLLRLLSGAGVIALGLGIMGLSVAVLGLSDPDSHEMIGLPSLGLEQGSTAAWALQVAVLLLYGVGCAFTWTPIMPETLAAASRAVLDRDVSSEAAAVFNGATALGEGLGPFLAGAASEHCGFGGMSFGAAALVLAYVPLLLCTVPPSDSSEGAASPFDAGARSPSRKNPFAMP